MKSLVTILIFIATYASQAIALKPCHSLSQPGFLCEVTQMIDRVEQKQYRSQAEAARHFRSLYEQIVSLDFKNYDLREVKAQAGPVIQMLFNARTLTREIAKGLAGGGRMSTELANAVQDLDRLARYTTEMVGEIAYARSTKESHKPAFGQGFPNTITATTGKYHFKSGDVILFRSGTYNSAAISRAGQVNALYSHAAIVFYNSILNKYQIVESLIEKGVIVNDLDDVMNHKLARATALRFKGHEKLAHLAATRAHNYAISTLNETRQNIPYDFSMQAFGPGSSYESIFCSELIRFAFDSASNGRILLPEYPSNIAMKNTDFYKRIGITAEKTFAPADLLIDSRFEVVADWFNYHRTADVRSKDLVIDKLFEWMNERGMSFREDPGIWAFSQGIRTLTQLPALGETVEIAIGPVPGYLTRQIIAAMAMLHLTADPLFESVKSYQNRHIRKTGYPLRAGQIYDHLERKREESGGEFTLFK